MSTIYPSNLSDTEWESLQRHLPLMPRRGRPRTHSLRAIFQELAAWCKAEDDWDLEVVERALGQRGFNVLPRRWVVERSLS